MASEFATLFGEWSIDGVTATPVAGISVEGQVAGAPQALGPVLVEEKARQVRTPTGQEVLSTRTVYVPPEAPYLPVLGDLLTFPSGYSGHVIGIHDLGAYGVLDHLEVSVE